MGFLNFTESTLDLSQVDPQFRRLVDLLFFSDRSDLDTSNLSIWLEGKQEHYQYLWSRCNRGLEIFWDEAFWLNRFDLLLSINAKKASTVLGPHLLSQFRALLIRTPWGTVESNNAHIQFVAWTKAKSQRKEDLSDIQGFLLDLPHLIQIGRLTNVVSYFTPHIFQDCTEYLNIISKKIGQSARNFEVLQALEKQGLKIDKQPIFKLTKELLLKRVPNRVNKRALFAMIDDASVMTYLQAEYCSATDRPRLLNLINNMDYKEVEERYSRNISNLLNLDPSVADDLLTAYLHSLYARRSGYKMSNIKRLVRVCKNFPQFSPKKVLAYLASDNRMSDIKHLLKAFPELKTLAPFI